MRTYIYNIIFLFAAVSLFGCGNGDRSVSKVDGIEFDSIVVDTTARLTADANSPSCRISLHTTLSYAAEYCCPTICRCLTGR